MTAARLTVDLGALRANYRCVAAVAEQGAAPPPGAVVKADAYGLGAGEVVRALQAEGCRDYFVANLAEGVALRDTARTGEARVYVFSGPLDQDAADSMARHDLIPVLNDARQLALWRTHRALPVAVHVDTGMNRLGFPSAEVEAARFADFRLCLLLSHLANADTPEDAMNAKQVARFRAVAERFPGVPTSLANSAGVLSCEGQAPRAPPLRALSKTSVGMARVGIALYGGNPFADPPGSLLQGAGFPQVVATLEAQVVGLRDVPPGEPVGYGGTFVTERATRLAVIGIGYADGFSRRLTGGEVAFGGVRLPVPGRVSMDLAQVDATRVAQHIQIGDWVEVFGNTIHLEEHAARSGTIGYEALTAIGARVQRRYVGGGGA